MRAEAIDNFVGLFHALFSCRRAFLSQQLMNLSAIAVVPFEKANEHSILVAMCSSTSRHADDLPANAVLARMTTLATQVRRVPSGALHDWASRAARAMLVSQDRCACTISLLRSSIGGWRSFHAGAAMSPADRETELALLCEASERVLREWNGMHRTLVKNVRVVHEASGYTETRAVHPNGIVAPVLFAGSVDQDVGGHVIELVRRCGDSVALQVMVWRDTPWRPVEVACVEQASMLLEPLACQLEADEKRGGWLSLRETEVLDRLSEGHTESEVAALLGRSPFTVHDHVKALYRKLCVAGRADLFRIALGAAAMNATGPSSPPKHEVTRTSFREAKPPATSPVLQATQPETPSKMKAELRDAC